MSKLTSGDVVDRLVAGKKSVAEAAENVAGKNLPGATPLQAKAFKSGSKIFGGAVLFIGATSVLDMGMKAAERAQAERQRKRQIKDLEEKQLEAKKKAESYRSGVSFVHGTDVGKIVFDMFDQRTGHHKMGNKHLYR